MSNPEPHIPQFSMADRFRKARTAAGLSQQQLADRMEISKKSVGNYETGATTHMRRSTVSAWALATGVPVAWLRDGTTTGDGPDQANSQSGCIDKFAPVLQIRPAPERLPERKPARPALEA